MDGVSRRGALRFAAGGGLSLGMGSAVWVLSASEALALIVRPIQIDMRCSGPRSASQLRVTNDHPYSLPVEITYQRLIIPEAGPPRFEEASGEEFLVFPPQTTIPQGATQNVRLQWVGDPALPESALFMFTVRQLPIPRAGESAPGIELLYSIQAVVAVAPPRGGPELIVDSVTRGQNQDGEPTAVLTVRNAAPVHGYLSMQRISLRQSNPAGEVVWSEAIEAGTVNSAVGMGLVPPNGMRRFSIPFALPDGEGFSAVLTEVLR